MPRPGESRGELASNVLQVAASGELGFSVGARKGEVMATSKGVDSAPPIGNIPGLLDLPIGDRAPDVVNAVIEIPLGSRGKYEYRPELGVFARDRVLSASMQYPTDYGFIPSTASDDGDPLDILVASFEPTFPGCLLRARPVGLLDMSDDKGRDQKIMAVPDDDKRFDEIRRLEDLPRHVLREVEHFFAVYKQLESKKVTIHGWDALEPARELILASKRRREALRATQD